MNRFRKRMGETWISKNTDIVELHINGRCIGRAPVWDNGSLCGYNKRDTMNFISVFICMSHVGTPPFLLNSTKGSGILNTFLRFIRVREHEDEKYEKGFIM